MPTYCYETKDGEIIEKVYPIGKAPRQIMSQRGDVAKRSFRAEGVKSASPKGWPMTCYASGVNAAQRDELAKYLKEKGVPTEVTKDGDPIYTSSGHRRKALKARGMFDRNSFI